jgi:serine/threonine protein kinase
VLREISIHRQLQHKHIARFYGVEVRRRQSSPPHSTSRRNSIANPFARRSGADASQRAAAHEAVETSIVMEYCAGGDLLHYLGPDHGMAAETVWAVTAQVASALRYMHDQDIVHRDIKSDNIALDDHGDANIIDFGAAQRIQGTVG